MFSKDFQMKCGVWCLYVMIIAGWWSFTPGSSSRITTRRCTVRDTTSRMREMWSGRSGHISYLPTVHCSHTAIPITYVTVHQCQCTADRFPKLSNATDMLPKHKYFQIYENNQKLMKTKIYIDFSKKYIFVTVMSMTCSVVCAGIWCNSCWCCAILHWHSHHPAHSLYTKWSQVIWNKWTIRIRFER